ncbi:tetratricopeptide repeat protein [Actinacidiphila bryophytorum]|uniref:tetratricopeptide repeat protein n=1 Tax=Actinacidiphila bryophytorum TaxID=1436133 RepID=UPI002176A667|nr:tetratricopeptide repeat protein [Actinacidiphila bryophytorum]UWE08507.1 tetratricopeptide repeat protein [Actinacidiphila bryophytorum]
MDQAEFRHHWVHGGSRRSRAAAVRSLAAPPALLPSGLPVDAHRRLRGPYTAANTVVRALVPEVLRRDAAPVRRYDIEVLSVAPELGDQVPNSRETLTSMALPAERTRYYARLRTKRIANGLAEFVRDALPPDGPRTLVVDNAEHAEATDVEFIAALVRRVDPARLTVVVCSGDGRPLDERLHSVLAARAKETALPTAQSVHSGGDAWSYVAGECLAEDADARAAYDALDPAERAALHDRRAAEVQAAGDFSYGLGAVPYHLERGGDPVGAALPVLLAAADHCLVNGFYDAVVDYGTRAFALLDGTGDDTLWWKFAVKQGLALSILSRTREAEEIYDRARLLSTDPAVHMACSYSTAMLYTRHNDPADRDEKKAKALLNGAVATASLLPDRVERAFQSAFYKNGRALVEVNLGDPVEALRLVTECVDDLDRQLEPEEHRLHRSVLKNNRARVYAGLGRLDEALADYAVVIEQDPNHAEHYLERGNILRRLGRTDEALADYARAMRLSPPFPEICYNRGDLRLSEGDTAGALADFDYVIDLEPDFVDAYVNRAGLHLDDGRLDAAVLDAEAGLALDPDNAYLHVVLGQVHAEGADHTAAEAAYDRAVAADPTLVTALSGRAAVRFENGRTDAALDDMCRAVDLAPDDPALRYNRAFLHQAREEWASALADLEIAAGLAPGDEDIAAALKTCRVKTGRA